MADRAAQDWPEALRSCVREFERTGDPAHAVDAATAAYYLQDWRETVRLASDGLTGSVASHAHYLIGAAWLHLEELLPAAGHLKIAAALHARAGDPRAEARDHHQLAGVWFKLGDYGQALRAEEASRAAAKRARDDRMVAYVDIARADIARVIGDLDDAELAIEDALVAARAPEDLVIARLKQGMLEIEKGQSEAARAPLELALAAEQGAPRPRREILEGLHLNLSYIERNANDLPAALWHLEQARRHGASTLQYRLNRALVRADGGHLASAAADLAAAEAETPRGDWAWWVPYQVARVAAQRGDDYATEAINADLRAIQQVTLLASRLGALGPTLIARHRAPYLHLLGLYAAAGRWSDVLDVIATMDGQALLASSAPAADPAPSVSAPVLPQVRRPASVVEPDDPAREIEAWRGQRLIIIVPGGGRVWRLEVDDGRVSLSDVGDAAELEDMANRLKHDPANDEAGDALGMAMLGPSLPADTYVALLAIGRLAEAPLAALRVAGAPASERYHVARARGFLPRARTPGATSAAVVIGDPDGDLPEARAEARAAARRLGVSPLLGNVATRAGLESVRGAGILHLATHTSRDRDGAFVHLVDGRITAAEIEKLTPAPGLVVLASCGGAAGLDDAGNGSLVAAFLDAGADTVIGTRWSVDDADAARLLQAFYAHGGATDPVRALGAAQRSAGVAPTTSAAFEAFVSRPTW